AGGLGIMTFSTLIIMVAGGRASLRSRSILQDTYTGSGKWSSRNILTYVIFFTLAIELAGALVLYFRFTPEFPPVTAAWYAFFHSVSAFCNAGFSLFPDSLTGYGLDPWVNVSVMGLILGGGIGFFVITELWESLKKREFRFSRLSLHTKLALTTTLVLIVSGTLVFLGMEWDNTLAGMPVGGKLITALFQSITPRTAGFNTVDMNRFSNETLSLFMLFMFVGACPGSCAGGIKTTTAAALFLLGISRFRGKAHAQAFGRTISDGDLNRATNILMLGMAVVIIGTMVLFMTEAGGISKVAGHQGFAEIIFEVISAFGTTGLSMGITSDLSTTGKLVISAIMFTGRLGPLLMGAALAGRISSRVQFARENIMTG
ncbi:MAG: hypothetical protein MI747_15650, partial [Desulfobacterales bacterium]|nr:hypothetical protein [Desulfobacterales bacterium]